MMKISEKLEGPTGNRIFEIILMNISSFYSLIIYGIDHLMVLAISLLQKRTQKSSNKEIHSLCFNLIYSFVSRSSLICPLTLEIPADEEISRLFFEDQLHMYSKLIYDNHKNILLINPLARIGHLKPKLSKLIKKAFDLLTEISNQDCQEDSQKYMLTDSRLRIDLLSRFLRTNYPLTQISLSMNDVISLEQRAMNRFRPLIFVRCTDCVIKEIQTFDQSNNSFIGSLFGQTSKAAGLDLSKPKYIARLASEFKCIDISIRSGQIPKDQNLIKEIHEWMKIDPLLENNPYLTKIFASMYLSALKSIWGSEDSRDQVTAVLESALLDFRIFNVLVPLFVEILETSETEEILLHLSSILTNILIKVLRINNEYLVTSLLFAKPKTNMAVQILTNCLSGAELQIRKFICSSDSNRHIIEHLSILLKTKTPSIRLSKFCSIINLTNSESRSSFRNTSTGFRVAPNITELYKLMNSSNYYKPGDHSHGLLESVNLIERVKVWKEVEYLIIVYLVTDITLSSKKQNKQIRETLIKRIDEGFSYLTEKADFIQEGIEVVNRMLKNDETNQELIKRICWVKEKECRQWAFAILSRLVERISQVNSEQLIKDSRLILTCFVDIYRLDRPRSEFQKVYSSLLSFMYLLGEFDERGHRVSESSNSLIHFFGIQIESILKNELRNKQQTDESLQGIIKCVLYLVEEPPNKESDSLSSLHLSLKNILERFLKEITRWISTSNSLIYLNCTNEKLTELLACVYLYDFRSGSTLLSPEITKMLEESSLVLRDPSLNTLLYAIKLLKNNYNDSIEGLLSIEVYESALLKSFTSDNYIMSVHQLKFIFEVLSQYVKSQLKINKSVIIEVVNVIVSLMVQIEMLISASNTNGFVFFNFYSDYHQKQIIFLFTEILIQPSFNQFIDTSLFLKMPKVLSLTPISHLVLLLNIFMRNNESFAFDILVSVLRELTYDLHNIETFSKLSEIIEAFISAKPIKDISSEFELPIPEDRPLLILIYLLFFCEKDDIALSIVSFDQKAQVFIRDILKNIPLSKLNQSISESLMSAMSSLTTQKVVDLLELILILVAHDNSIQVHITTLISYIIKHKLISSSIVLIKKSLIHLDASYRESIMSIEDSQEKEVLQSIVAEIDQEAKRNSTENISSEVPIRKGAPPKLGKKGKRINN